jgi:protein phosphatase
MVFSMYHSHVISPLPMGVAIGTLPRMASRRLLQILQNHLSAFTATESLLALLNRVQQDYVALSENPRLHGMAATLVGVCLLDNKAVIFNVGDARAYLLADGQARLLSRDHSLVNDLIDNHEITSEQAIGKASILQGLTCQFVADANWDDFSPRRAQSLLCRMRNIRCNALR